MDLNPYESPANLNEAGQSTRISPGVTLLAVVTWFAVACVLYSVIHIPIVSIGKWILTSAAFTAWIGVGIGSLTMRRLFIWIGGTIGGIFGAGFALLAVQ